MVAFEFDESPYAWRAIRSLTGKSEKKEMYRQYVDITGKKNK